MISLFDYQQRGFESIQACFSNGQRRVLVCMPTGAGKTRLGVACADAHPGNVLWVAHRNELVTQPIKAMRELGVDAGLVASGKRIQVATIQGLLASGHRPEISLLVVDEARHCLASEWSEIPKAYPNARIIGLDATPERADGSGLGAMFDSLVTVASYKELIALGRLVDCDVISPSKQLKAGTIAQHPLSAYKQHVPGQKAVLFAPNVNAAAMFALDFRTGGVAAAHISGEQSKKTRDGVLEDYAAGRIQVICNVNILTDGWDDPPTSAVILARGCSTGGTYIQMTGRALRAFPGKTRATLLDLRGVSHIHGSPTEDRIYSLAGRAIRRKADLADARYCSVCGCLRVDVEPVCPECGVEAATIGAPRVVNAKLEKRVYLPKASEEEKIRKLAALMRECQVKKWKPAAAFVRHKVLFGAYPTQVQIAAARRLTLGPTDLK